MSDRNAFDHQLEREIDNLAGPEPRVDVREIVEGATTARRRTVFGPWFGSVQIATAMVLALLVVISLGFFLGSDRSVLVPAASPSADPSPSLTPAGQVGTPVSGTWAMPDPAACAEARPMASEEWIISLAICDGLRFDVPDDPRLTGEGQIRYEEWDEGTAPEIWRVFNDGGWWKSQRFQNHDRFVFRGEGGYDGLTAVITLAGDGTLSGLVRAREPEVNDG